MEPLVSVIVPSYNHERYVGTCIRSALAQTLREIEVIVIDDASTDGSRELYRAFSDPRLRFELNEHNRGISPVFNQGLRLARGRYVAYLCSDDYWRPDHLGPKVEILEKTGAGMVYGCATVVDGDDRDITSTIPFFREVPGDRVLFELIRSVNFIPFISVVMRRDAALAVGGFDEGIVTIQDYDLWLRLAAWYGVGFHEARSVVFRWHGSNVSQPDPKGRALALRERLYVYEKTYREMKDRLPQGVLSPRKLARYYARLAAGTSDPDEACRAWRKSIGYAPWKFHRWPRYLRALAKRSSSRGSSRTL